MAQNGFEAVIGDRAPDIISDSDSEYTQAFLNIYKESTTLIAEGTPIPVPLPHVWQRQLAYGDKPDDTKVSIPGIAARFYGADQNFPLSGRPWLKRSITIQIRPADFVLGSLARNDLGYRMNTEAASTLELRIDANTAPYAAEESKLFDLSWILTTVEGTESPLDADDEPSELTIYENVVKASNDIAGNVKTSSRCTFLRFARHKDGDTEELETERSVSRNVITPDKMIVESQFHVLNPAGRLLKVISL